MQIGQNPKKGFEFIGFSEKTFLAEVGVAIAKWFSSIQGIWG